MHECQINTRAFNPLHSRVREDFLGQVDGVAIFYERKEGGDADGAAAEGECGFYAWRLGGVVMGVGVELQHLRESAGAVIGHRFAVALLHAGGSAGLDALPDVVVEGNDGGPGEIRGEAFRGFDEAGEELVDGFAGTGVVEAEGADVEEVIERLA